MTDRDFVVLPRDALFQFFGAVALPTDDTDCAPIAARIIEWVEDHDLSGAVIAPRPDDVVVIDGQQWRVEKTHLWWSDIEEASYDDDTAPLQDDEYRLWRLVPVEDQ